jgi:hypothetical protein
VGKGGRGGEAGARADLASSASLEALCVRLNSAAFVEQELVLLSHRLAAATRQPLAGSEPGPLGEAAAECERVAMHLAALISARVVHTELADLWPRLYSRAAQPPAAAAGKASKQPQQRARDEEASRGVGIAALLERMDPFLGARGRALRPARPRAAVARRRARVLARSLVFEPSPLPVPLSLPLGPCLPSPLPLCPRP